MSEKQNCQLVQVGIAGLGRSGWNIHAETISRMSDRFRLVAVMDPEPARRAEAAARFACAVYDDYNSLIADPSVELLIIATPNHLHAQQAIAAMQNGKQVLCEKPFARSTAEADTVISAAGHYKRILSIYHNRRFDPHFQKVREIVDSGVLGRIVQVRFTMHHFSRRWDWQTLKQFGGGTLGNAGSHFLDQLLSFFPDELPEVYCHTDRALTLGDAEDHCVVMLRAPGQPLVQMELSGACGYPQDNWLIMGINGTLRGNFERLEWRVALFDQLPARILDRQPTPDRSYNNENVPWEEHAWQVPPDQAGIQYTHQRFYESLYQTLRCDAPLVVTPEQVRRQMQVLDACRKI